MQIESIKFVEENISTFGKLVNKLENSIENFRNSSSNPKFFISLFPVPAFAYFGSNKMNVMEYHWYQKYSLSSHKSSYKQ